MAAARDRCGDFDQQRRLADAGIAAEQQHRAPHQAAAGDAIEFGDARGKPRCVVSFALERLDGEQPAFAGRASRGFSAFLDQRNPGEIGPGAEPQLDHVVSPVLAGAGIALDECGTAVSTGGHEAARVQ